MKRDLELYQFLTQVWFSSVVAIFCIAKLSIPVSKGKVNESLYSSILTAIVGYWLPSPSGKKQSNLSQVSVDSEIATINTSGDPLEK